MNFIKFKWRKRLVLKQKKFEQNIYRIIQMKLSDCIMKSVVFDMTGMLSACANGTDSGDLQEIDRVYNEVFG